MGIPSRRSISASKSRKVRPSFSATKAPTVVLPDPGRPTKTMCGLLGSLAETVLELRKVSVIISSRLPHRIAAELLEHRFREHDREHRLRYNSHGWHRRDVTAFSGRLG